MVRTLSFIVSLLIGPSTVHAQADWDWRACEDGRDPVAAIAACTRLIDGGILGYLSLATALYSRGVHFANVAEIDRAIADQSRSIKIEPLHPRAYNGRGNAYYIKGDIQRAIQDYDAQIKISPRHEDAYNGRGLAYAAMGELDRAIEDYDRQIEIDPRHAHAYNSRGRAYALKGEFDRAIEDYDRQIEIDPQHRMRTTIVATLTWAKAIPIAPLQITMQGLR